jgi:hypothetical protein
MRERRVSRMKNRKRVLLVGAVVLALVLAAVGVVNAITNGEPDGDNHPYVALITDDMWMCSGAAISDRVLVTAAHCFDYAEVFVTFDSGPPFTWHTGIWYPHPDWCPGCGPGLKGFDTHDVAVVVLDEPVTLPEYAELPTEGLVDTLPMMQDVDLVGYGIHGWIRGGGWPFDDADFDGMRYYAPAKLVKSKHVHSDEYIKLTANPAQGKGGVCFGDSGGPDLLGDTDIILALNSYVTSYNCTGVTYSNRIDVPYALEFINGFLDE